MSSNIYQRKPPANLKATVFDYGLKDRSLARHQDVLSPGSRSCGQAHVSIFILDRRFPHGFSITRCTGSDNKDFSKLIDVK